MRNDLRGVRVVAVEQAVAVPLCSRHLADLGADVIKVERLSGDFARDYDDFVQGYSSHFVWLNRGKRSVALDLKTSEGKRLLGELLRSADVLVCNLAPGAFERIFTDDDLVGINPRLIRCFLSGYGTQGPYAHRKAYDMLIQGRRVRSRRPAHRRSRPSPGCPWRIWPVAPTPSPPSTRRSTRGNVPASAGASTSPCSTCSSNG